MVTINDADKPNNKNCNNITPVTVALSALSAGTVPFSTLEAAFGPGSLGLILVRGLPDEYSALRHSVLSYSSYLANLPEEELGIYTSV